MEHTLEQLSTLTDIPARTVRYYIQQGLVDRPTGSRKTARYSETHVEQLLTIKKWQSAGLSLDAIQRILKGEAAEPAIEAEPGSLRVLTHIHLAAGVELTIDPQKAGMNSEQLRTLSKQIVALIAAAEKDNTHD